jgi:formamidopyrimidine-DNA glycosylase
MPELPEVETVRAGLHDVLVGNNLTVVSVYQSKLRYPVPGDLSDRLAGQRIVSLARRAKYLLVAFEQHTVIIHLGMSGSLRWLPNFQPPKKHDHIDFHFTDGGCLRFHDPRRFGLVVLTEPPVDNHPLLSHLGPEPLEDSFNSQWLFNHSRNRKVAVKSLLMDNKIVVGVGNIYANESLFLSRIDPRLTAGELTAEECEILATTVKKVLLAAIKAGGTTLNDFVNGHGSPGYFQQQLYVYGREEQPCLVCGTMIARCRIGQRSTFYCPECQGLKSRRVERK